MGHSTFGLGRRFAALAGAVALALVGGAAAAQADTPAPSAGNINESTPTSLTIHKYDGTPGAAGDGTQKTDTSQLGNALAGVTFKITPVTSKNGQVLDLHTQAGWDLLQGVKASDVTAANGYAFGTPVSVTTGADGSVTQSLPQAVYLVTETDPGTNNVISPAQPFLVTLPLPQSNGNWLYDVHVYPKNKINTTTPTKEVADPVAPVLGSQVTWTINAPVPALAAGDTYKSFVITDQLDSRLSYTSATVDGFTSGTDYTVTESNGLVTITFTPAGVAKLSAGQTVVAKVTTKVTSLGTDGVIKNSATVNTNGSKVDTNKPSTNWGPLQILKYAQQDESKTLSGAHFEIYTAKDAAQPVGTLVTDANGKASISLWVGNNDVTSKTYWVKETQAPAGYTLPQDPWTQVTVKANGDTAPVVLKIANTQQPAVTLPFTGAEGQLLLTVTGIALVLVAVGAALVISRRRAAQR
ncbi:SpaH/EbpB family LPXTG-anchored major pilin [Arthrobacter sp. RAF14]|uniref:SpaH/EbpB family LPXTG-anchored major pilin n=1 Tax=Arthrobacter sp. RAF14 TaxID=3233051 RepID=UPI003F8F396C